jgi:hypothetical protein
MAHPNVQAHRRVAAAAAEAHFASRRDRWLVVVLWATAILLVAAGLAQIGSAAALTIRVIMLVSCLTGAAVLLWVLYGTTYMFVGNVLHVRSGPFRMTLPLAEIDSVVPVHNTLSGPACSMDRLHVRYHHSSRTLLVSPEDKPGFLHALIERSPHLTLAGDRVVRVPTARAR